MPLWRQQGSQLGSQTSSTSQTLLFSAILSIKKHLPSNITVCILIFPGKRWQLYYPTNINCAFVCFCTACALEMCFGLSSNPLQCPQRDLCCYKGLLRLFPVYTQLFLSPGTCAFWLCITKEWQRLKKCMPLAAYFKTKQPWFSETSFKV